MVVEGSELLQQLDLFVLFVLSHYLFNLFSTPPIWHFFSFFLHVVGVIVLSFYFTNVTAAIKLIKVCCLNTECGSMLDFQSKLTDLKSADACLFSKIMNHSGGHVASIEPVENCKNPEETGRSNTSQKERTI